MTISEQLERALAHHQAGQLQEANTLYGQILQEEPNHPEALHLMGVLACQVGSPDVGENFIQQALQLLPTHSAFHASLGTALREQGKTEAAAVSYQEAVRLNPQDAEAFYHLGCTLQELGRFEAAKDAFEVVTTLIPEFPDVYLQLGWLAQQAKELDAALGFYRQALQLDATFYEAFNNLGNVFRLQGKHAEALEAYQEAVRLKADYPEALYNLAQLLEKQGNLEAAVSHYQKALQGRPHFAEAHVRLGLILSRSKDLQPSIAHYQEALRIEPEFAEAHFHLANAYKTLDRLEEAVAHYQQAIQFKPDYVDAYNALGLTYEKMNLAEEAVAAYKRSIAIQPSDGWRMTMMTMLPAIYRSRAEITLWRNRFSQNLKTLLAEETHIRVVCRPNFYLVYHGENDRELQRDYAQLFRKLSLPYQEHPRHPKPRIGFISSYFRKGHTIGRLNRGIIQHLSREQFEVRVFTVGDDYLETGEVAIHPEDRYIQLPLSDLVTSRKRVAEEELDLLVYADIGMEPLTYFMALSRLAKVQCVTWGHPVTTGMETMDYFLSSEDFEVPHAQEHYTETLVRLKELYPYYLRPTLESPKSREAFGLPPEGNLYICPQSLFKFHPDFDAVLAGILRQDPTGHVILLHHTYKPFNQVLLDRWQDSMPDVMNRIQFVDRVNRQDFMNLMALADVLLDPLHFGGGNTTLEALAFGVPVVTLPSEFLRCRLSYGFYRKMGVMDCVAQSPEDYVAIAVRLGTDLAYRREVRDNIQAASAGLFENLATVRELETFFHWAIEKAYGQEACSPFPGVLLGGSPT